MELGTNGIVIPDEDKRDHYVLEMYRRKEFNRREMTEYEGKPDADKDWAGTTNYFKELISELEEYDENSGGPTKKARFESAANIVEGELVGDQLRRYISGIASKKEADRAEKEKVAETMMALRTNIQEQLAAKDQQITELVKEVQQLTANMLALSTQVANANNGCGNDNSGGGGGGGGA